MEIALFLLAGCLLVFLASRSQGQRIPGPPFQATATPTTTDPETAPIINYSTLVADPRSGQWLRIEAPADFPHHYGILTGQYIRLQWQVLHADLIHIDGIGYVQAVGSQDLFPQQATRYRIQACNRHHQAEQEIVVHVFPVPVIEHILTPIPDLNARIELKIDPLPIADWPKMAVFPRIQAPCLVQLQEKLNPESPKTISLEKTLYKSSLNNNSFKNLINNILNNNRKPTGHSSGSNRP